MRIPGGGGHQFFCQPKRFKGNTLFTYAVVYILKEKFLAVLNPMYIVQCTYRKITFFFFSFNKNILECRLGLDRQDSKFRMLLFVI